MAIHCFDPQLRARPGAPMVRSFYPPDSFVTPELPDDYLDERDEENLDDYLR